jgi:hypothetical protein
LRKKSFCPRILAFKSVYFSFVKLAIVHRKPLEILSDVTETEGFFSLFNPSELVFDQTVALSTVNQNVP